jgi:hypothetical protein
MTIFYIQCVYIMFIYDVKNVKKYQKNLFIKDKNQNLLTF